MNGKLITLCFTDGEVDTTLGDNYRYFTTPCDMTVIYVCASPSANDADLTIDINDDGTGVIAAVSCAVKAAPGTWKSKPMGGTNAAVFIAGGSVCSLDANDAAADTVVHVQIWAVTGEKFA